MPSEPDTQGLLFPVDRPDPATRPAPYAAVTAMEPLSRHADPVGSFQAAERQRPLAGPGRLAVYHALRSNQGATSAELAQATGLDRHDVARRLPELARARWVCKGPPRRCRIAGVTSITWWIARRWLQKPDRHAAKRPDRPDGWLPAKPAPSQVEGAVVEPPARSSPVRSRRACWRLLALCRRGEPSG